MFWNREELPPELRDKKPAEIVAALAKLKELEQKGADFDIAKTSWDDKEKAHQTELEQIRARNQELEAAASEEQRRRENPAAPGPGQQQPPSFFENPDEYINQKLAGVTAATLASIRMSAGLQFQSNLNGRDRKIFDKYRGEIEQVMNTYPPNVQGVPQNWQTALIYIKGLHESELSKQEADSPFFAEPGARGGHEEPPQEAATDKLTPDEEEVCERFHWDKAGYLKRKKEMSIHQSEKGAFARFPVPERRAS